MREEIDNQKKKKKKKKKKVNEMKLYMAKWASMFGIEIYEMIKILICLHTAYNYMLSQISDGYYVISVTH